MRLEIETLQKEMVTYDEHLQTVADSIEAIHAAIIELNEEVKASKVSLSKQKKTDH